MRRRACPWSGRCRSWRRRAAFAPGPNRNTSSSAASVESVGLVRLKAAQRPQPCFASIVVPLPDSARTPAQPARPRPPRKTSRQQRRCRIPRRQAEQPPSTSARSSGVPEAGAVAGDLVRSACRNPRPYSTAPGRRRHRRCETYRPFPRRSRPAAAWPRGRPSRRTAATPRPPAESGAEGWRRSEWIVWIRSPPGVSIARANRLPGLRQGVRPTRLVLAQLAQCRAQIGVRLHRPFAQPPEQAVLHLGRGGLGVGQAQDVLRLDPVQQQPRHPVGQHAGLARPGIGRQPGRGRRDRRPATCRSLAALRVIRHPRARACPSCPIRRSATGGRSRRETLCLEDGAPRGIALRRAGDSAPISLCRSAQTSASCTGCDVGAFHLELADSGRHRLIRATCRAAQASANAPRSAMAAASRSCLSKCFCSLCRRRACRSCSR